MTRITGIDRSILRSILRSTLRNLVAAGIMVLLVGRPAVAQTASADESLYDRLGGLEAIALVVNDFMDDFMADPVIMANPAVRERKTAQVAPYIRYQVTTLVCQLTGGPCTYTGMDMGAAHAGLNVSATEWDRMAELFGATLARHGVPERETQELFALVGPTRGDIVVGGNDG
jgi:hemoglobin